jgi:hypothetical protein
MVVVAKNKNASTKKQKTHQRVINLTLAETLPNSI